MFILCINGGCPLSCWCKRFTYNRRSDASGMEKRFFECGGELYVMNKAREIYERDNPNDSIYDQLKQRKHEDNNRESGVREDNDTDRRTEEGVEDITPEQDSVLQLQRSSDRRSDIPSIGVPEFVQRIIDGEVSVEEGLAVLSNTSFDGVSPAWTQQRRTDDSTADQGVREINRNPGVWFNINEVFGINTENTPVHRRPDSTDNRRSETDQPNS